MLKKENIQTTNGLKVERNSSQISQKKKKQKYKNKNNY